MSAIRKENTFSIKNVGIPGILWILSVVAIVGAWRGRYVSVTIPALVLLVAQVVVHSIYRLWWGYYTLHFAIPLAWLASIGVLNTWDALAAVRIESKYFLRYAIFGPIILFTAMYATRAVGVISEDWESLETVAKMEGESILVKLDEVSGAGATTFVSTSAVHAFYSKLSVDPDLAVLPQKRFASGQLSEKMLFLRIRDTNPDVILVHKSIAEREEKWKSWVYARYRLVYDGMGMVLFCRPEFNVSIDDASTVTNLLRNLKL